MSTLANQSATRRSALGDPRYELRVSVYDRAASLLIALVVLLGITFAMLLLIWLTNRVFAKSKPVPVIFEEVQGGTGDGLPGEGIETAQLDTEELAEEDLSDQPALEQTLALVETAVADRQADLSDPQLTDEIESGGEGSARKGGPISGEGTGTGGAGIPRWQRWELFFAEGSDLDTYAKQLDHFQIELGVLGEGGTVQYASHLADAKPTLRTGRAADDERLYMSWRHGGLEAADRQLLAKAGMADEGRLVLHFYPADVENRLAGLERQFAGRDASQIRRTRFGVRPSGDGYDFFVMEQTPL